MRGVWTGMPACLAFWAIPLGFLMGFAGLSLFGILVCAGFGLWAWHQVHRDTGPDALELRPRLGQTGDYPLSRRRPH